MNTFCLYNKMMMKMMNFGRIDINLIVHNLVIIYFNLIKELIQEAAGFFRTIRKFPRKISVTEA